MWRASMHTEESTKNGFDLGVAHDQWCWLFFVHDQEGPARQHFLEVLTDFFQNYCWYCGTELQHNLLMFVKLQEHISLKIR